MQIEKMTEEERAFLAAAVRDKLARMEAQLDDVRALLARLEGKGALRQAQGDPGKSREEMAESDALMIRGLTRVKRGNAIRPWRAQATVNGEYYSKYFATAAEAAAQLAEWRGVPVADLPRQTPSQAFQPKRGKALREALGRGPRGGSGRVLHELRDEGDPDVEWLED